LGRTCHDTFFLEISPEFQKFLEDNLGLKITLNRRNAVVAEMKSSGAQVPDSRLRNLGFDPNSIRADVQNENPPCHLSDAEYTDAEYSESDSN
jgi:hypothetical protein